MLNKFHLILFVLLFNTLPSLASVKYIDIKAEGRALSLHAAVNNALLSAVAQVHGKTIESERVSQSMEVSMTTKNDDAYLASEGYLELIKEKTKGAVSSYQIISKEETTNGNWRVVVVAKIAQYKRSKRSNRMRLAILPFKGGTAFVINNDEYTLAKVQSNVAQKISEYLVQTRKFAILDRTFSKQIDNELASISAVNTHKDEIAKLGQKLVADFLLVGTIESLYYKTTTKKMRSSDRIYQIGNGSFRVSYKIIEVATQQTVFSDTKEVKITHSDLKNIDKSNSDNILNKMSSKLGKSLTFDIQNQIFPLAIVSYSNGQVVLSQGGKTVNKGDKYKVYKSGKKLYDPYTKEYLGKEEEYCCDVTITRVTSKQSYAQLSNEIMVFPKDVPPKTYILRELIKNQKIKKVKIIKKDNNDDDW